MFAKAVFLGSLSLLFVVAFLPATATSASCTNAANYGNASLTISLPQAGSYSIWLRMRPTLSSGKTVQLELDSTQCWNMGGSTLPTGSWTWVNWTTTPDQVVTTTITSAGVHSIKLIGSATDVHVDKILFLGTNELCADSSKVPKDAGDNCAAAPTTTVITPTPITNSGTTITPSVVTKNSGNISKIQYFINGELVQTSDGEQSLDTSKLPKGTYQLETVVTLKDGTEVKETTTIEVQEQPSYTEKNRMFLVSTVAILGVGIILVAILVKKFGFTELKNKVLMHIGHHNTLKQVDQEPPAINRTITPTHPPEDMQ